jgi:hypothetical protein
LQKSQTHLPSLLGGILFSLSGLFLFGIGLFMGLTAMFSLFTGEAVEVQRMIIFATLGFEAILLFMAAFFSFQKMLQKTSADQTSSLSFSPQQIIIVVLAAGASLLIGNQIGGIETVNWLVLPIITVPAITLPLGVILALGVQRLPLGTRWQSWSVLGLGMTLTPFLLLALEAFVAIIFFVGIVAYVAAQPELAFELQGLSEQMLILGPNSEATIDLLAPILTQPGVIVTALLYMAVLVPAIEEIFKPLGVWLFAGKLDSTAQGFTLGALSGAGYALIETVGVSAQAPEWASLLFSRIGTGLLHITTSALMGAAIVAAWRERRYLRLLGTYFLATLLHGLWNAFAMLFTFSTLAELGGLPGRLGMVQPMIIIVMSILAAGLFLILIISNQKLRKTVLLTEPDTPAYEPGQTL